MKPAQSNPMALEVHGVEHCYRGHLVLTGITLEAARGDVVCILGPSGCGKTTLLRIVAGLITPSAGSISIDARPQDDIPTYKRNLGFVFQQPSLFPNMNVNANVAFPFTKGRHQLPRGVRSTADAVSAILARTGLSRHGLRSTGTLSGGEKQRVALARALVYQPSLLLLDEPLSSVDNVMRDELLDLLVGLHRDFRTTMLYVTHDEREALRVASHLAVMDRDGHILTFRPTADVVADPQYAEVARLLADWNLFLSSAADAPPADALCAQDASLRPYKEELAEPGARVIGVRMSAVTVAPRSETVASDMRAIPAVIRNCSPWHEGWRLTCELNHSGDDSLPLTCFSPLQVTVPEGEQCNVLVKKEDVRAFTN